ncbi:Asparagine-rich zinc finger protein AZF1 [Neolecta irregularis DAH-3]|uniref:Asparagine-rich zinc finger protein AZF1 n=1 Tax=Neolecta irregularis (strain DAH-3) TaxID=1198029 RepID=A0A1U7LT24_NEOID|nr:Asparagine-rich zinc finger protein AZF1 [Neolecta irregularis DAH-3]|eukprot:OLL25779.1 Asparagine-rich zinc finger protein AZF1 [Neolecta irregularis DAH-3]
MAGDVGPHTSSENVTQQGSAIDSLESLLDFPGLNSFNFSDFASFVSGDFELPTSPQLCPGSTLEQSAQGNLSKRANRDAALGNPESKSNGPPRISKPVKPSSVDILVAKIQAVKPTDGLITEIPEGMDLDSEEKARQASLLAKAKAAVIETVNNGLPSDCLPKGVPRIPDFPPAIHQLFEAALRQEELKIAEEGYGETFTKQTTKNVRNFECTIPGCRRSFPQNAHLEIHMRSHTGDRPFKCNHLSCTKSFAQKGNLATHQRKHTGSKPYLCSYDDCGKSFTQLSNLKTHKRTHNVDRPFTCMLEGCKQSFAQLGNLKRHQNRHHKNTLEEYIQKFSSAGPTTLKTPKDIEIFEYFAKLYKNSNKGIKGRGKEPGHVPKPRKRRSRNRAASLEPQETQLPVLPFEFTLPEEFQVLPGNDRNSEMQLTGALGLGSFSA